MYELIFLKPNRLDDCRKIVNHIKDSKIVHINLEDLDEKLCQRVLDFISGAIYIKEAQFINPTKNVFVSIPKGRTFYQDETVKISHNDQVSEVLDLRYDEEEAIKPKFNK
jgi:cell division inhibitor SepF